MWYQYHHGWISEQTWLSMLKQCCDEPYTRNTCHFGNPPNTQCAKYVAEASKTTGDGSINVYDWIVDCYRHRLDSQDKLSINDEHDRAMKVIWDRLKTKNNYLKQAMDEQGVESQVNVICINSNGAYNYLNRKDVKEAINIRESQMNVEWNICSDTLDYKALDCYDNEDWLYESMWEMDDKLYTLVYNGDVDPGINFLVSQWFVDDFNQTIKRDYRQWFVEYDNNAGQV